MSNLKLFISTFLLAFAVSFGGFVTNRAVQAEVENTVYIDQLVLSRCGTQHVYASGTAAYGPTASHLMVDIDGVHVFELAKQEAWVTGFAELNPGSHFITARIHNTDGTNTFVTQEFTVPECPKPEASGDEGDDGPDCCPGPDPIVEEPKVQKKPAVKSATTSNDNGWDILRPINALFRSVFGRTPTYEEWKYWADRLLTDKPEYDALLGAMQWHKFHGLIR